MDIRYFVAFWVAIFLEMVYTAYFMGPVGSIEGQRLALDPMEAGSCVSGIPWNSGI